MDYTKYNEKFWDNNAELRGPWSEPCTKEDILSSQNGRPHLCFLPGRPLPWNWLPNRWNGLNILCLGMGGGNFVPLIAATGAKVTSLDISQEQLRLDKQVCDIYNLKIETHHGDLQDLAPFRDKSFDLIFILGLSYVKDVYSVWSQVFNILEAKGELICGAISPTFFSLDQFELAKGELVLKHKIPYDSTQDMQRETLVKRKKLLEPFKFGHLLENFLGGLTKSGFFITGFQEGKWKESYYSQLDSVMPTLMAIKATKF